MPQTNHEQAVNAKDIELPKTCHCSQCRAIITIPSSTSLTPSDIKDGWNPFCSQQCEENYFANAKKGTLIFCSFRVAKEANTYQSKPQTEEEAILEDFQQICCVNCDLNETCFYHSPNEDCENYSSKILGLLVAKKGAKQCQENQPQL